MEIRDKISRQWVKLEVNQTLMDTDLTQADHYIIIIIILFIFGEVRDIGEVRDMY